MDLNDRKIKILQAIINDYIDTAEPVGSRTISKKYDLGVSSATIRNEMSDLEELGLLEQPHASAGRIPSDKAYRIYVDQFLDAQAVGPDQLIIMQDLLKLKITEIDVLMKQAATILSQLTNYTTMVTTPQLSKSKIKNIQLVPIDSTSILVVLVTNENIVNNKLVKCTHPIQGEVIQTISYVISKKLSGLSLEQIHLPLILEIQQQLGIYEMVLTPILKAISEIISSIDNRKLYMGGTTKLLEHPEFRDLDKARKLLSVLEDDSHVSRVLEVGSEKGLKISIGKENADEVLQECSIIKATYTLDDEVVGTIGVLGPTRMEYSKVLSIVDMMTKDLSKILRKMSK